MLCLIYYMYIHIMFTGADPGGGLLGLQPPLWKMGKYVSLKI